MGLNSSSNSTTQLFFVTSMSSPSCVVAETSVHIQTDTPDKELLWKLHVSRARNLSPGHKVGGHPLTSGPHLL